MAEKKKDKVIACPRDKSLMTETVVEHAFLDVCGKCGGTFFDSGEMFAAFGIKADPSYWDRSETGGTVRNGELECSRCHMPMLVQDIKYESTAVEIDRCGKCGGIWLDKGEIEKIMAIGEKLQGVVDAEKQKAQDDLAKMGDVDFSPNLIARFLGLFRKK